MTKSTQLGLTLVLPVAWAMTDAQPADLELSAYRAPAVPELAADGFAVVALSVRADGYVDDAVALHATDRGLADAALEAVMQWRFERDPVGRGASPGLVLRREIVEFDFRRRGVVTSMSHAESARPWLPREQEPVVRTLLRDELISPLQRQTAEESEAESILSGIDASGTATVSFVIDERGRVRVPLVIAADDPSLRAAALAIVTSWRFEPPLHGGRSVLVEDRRTFTFGAAPEDGD